MIRVLWSGLTGKTGQAALAVERYMPEVQIVAGLKRELSGADDICFCGGYGISWYRFRDLLEIMKMPKEHLKPFDVLVDFSNREAFDNVLALAVHMNVPLISGTSGLSDEQMQKLFDATWQIPVFRGGNFRFAVKEFIDEAVDLAECTPGTLTLYESFYQGKSLPSETATVIRRKIKEATGKTICVHSTAILPRSQFECRWQIGGLKYNVADHRELAQDVLEIAKYMVNARIRGGRFYELDDILI